MKKTTQEQMFLQVVSGTVQHVITAFLVDRRSQNLSKNTLRSYTTEMRMFGEFLDRQGVSLLHELTPDLVRLYLLHLSQRRNPGGVRVSYRVIRTLCLWLEQETDGDFVSPTHKIPSPKVAEQPLQPVARSDFDALVATCDKKSWHGARDRAILLTLLDTGLRASELCSLNLSDIDLWESSLLVKMSKNRRPRTVFFGVQTRKSLRMWLRARGSVPGALFITAEMERLTYTGLRQVIRRRSHSAGVSGVALHDFRRAFTLKLLQSGVSETTISRLLGHRDATLIQRYAKQSASDLKELYVSPVDDD
jgi:site-specific recombinase XerD